MTIAWPNHMLWTIFGCRKQVFLTINFELSRKLGCVLSDISIIFGGQWLIIIFFLVKEDCWKLSFILFWNQFKWDQFWSVSFVVGQSKVKWTRTKRQLNFVCWEPFWILHRMVIYIQNYFVFHRPYAQRQAYIHYKYM